MVEVLGNSLNNPTTTLNGSITSGSASLTVLAPTAPDVWPTTGTFRVKVDLELIAVTAATSAATSLTVVSRGVEGTTAAAHSSGANVDLVASAAAVAALSLSLFAAPTADVAWGSNKITAVKDPTLAQDAATKNYVDIAIAGLDWKAAVRLATTAALPTNIYANGASGVGATLTGTAFGALTIDSVTVVTGDRVLIKNEVATANNGIYVVTTVGAVATLYVLTRSADYNQTTEIQAGDAVYVVAGTANVDTSWVQTTTGTITVGTTAIVFTQFGGNLVTSVFGRTGAVVAAANDYTLTQVAAPTADFGFASHKITSLLNGTGAQDGAAFGQIIPNPSMSPALTGSGYWFLSSPLPFVPMANLQLVQAVLYLGMPIVLPYAITINKLGCFIGTAGSAGSVIRLGIYQITIANPYAPVLTSAYATLIVDGGTLASTGTGQQSITLGTPQVVAAYTPFSVGLCPQGTPATTPKVYTEQQPTIGAGSPLGQNGILTNVPSGGVTVTAITGSLPATFTPTAVSQGANGWYGRSA